MSSQLRSKQGCWTCRIRKKKCDETRPNCAACEKLSINCYGYGPKPDWMDGGEREKAVVDKLRQSIRSAPRRRLIPKESEQRLPLHLLAPDTVTKTVGNSLSEASSTTLPSLGSMIDKNGSNNQCKFHLPAPITPGEMTNVSLSAEDTVLLVHFLDKIFPLQFPAYEPLPLESGRAWIFSLLLSTKPLFHAALALSSYHRRLIISSMSQGLCQVAGVLQQASHLETCLREFRKTMKSVHDFVKDKHAVQHGLGAEMSTVQLVYFELFAGEASNTWRIHLAAATSLVKMFLSSCSQDVSCLNISLEAKSLIKNDIAITNESAKVIQEAAAFRFIVTSTVWLDTLSCITTGLEPKLYDLHLEILIRREQFKMSTIFGVENWVVYHLAGVASLHAERKRDREQGKMGSMWEGEYRRKCGDIGVAVEFGIKKLGEDIDRGFEKPSILRPQLSKEQRGRVLTKIWALAVLVYMDQVMLGLRDLESASSRLQEAVVVLSRSVSSEMIPMLVPALFLLGCAARDEEQKGLFREILSPKTFVQPLFKHRWKILPILEEVWRRQNDVHSMSWDDVLGIANDVILM